MSSDFLRRTRCADSWSGMMTATIPLGLEPVFLAFSLAVGFILHAATISFTCNASTRSSSDLTVRSLIPISFGMSNHAVLKKIRSARAVYMGTIQPLKDDALTEPHW